MKLVNLVEFLGAREDSAKIAKVGTSLMVAVTKESRLLGLEPGRSMLEISAWRDEDGKSVILLREK